MEIVIEMAKEQMILSSVILAFTGDVNWLLLHVPNFSGRASLLLV